MHSTWSGLRAWGSRPRSKGSVSRSQYYRTPGSAWVATEACGHRTRRADGDPNQNSNHWRACSRDTPPWSKPSGHRGEPTSRTAPCTPLPSRPYSRRCRALPIRSSPVGSLGRPGTHINGDGSQTGRSEVDHSTAFPTRHTSKLRRAARPVSLTEGDRQCTAADRRPRRTPICRVGVVGLAVDQCA